MIRGLARAVFTRPKTAASGSREETDPVIELLRRASAHRRSYLIGATVPQEAHGSARLVFDGAR